MFLVFYISGIYAQTLDEKLLEIDIQLNEKAKIDSAGLAVIITLHDTVIYERYFGYSNFENKTKLKSDDVLGIASMSKQFLGMATLILVNEDKLDLKANIDQYMPEIEIAIRNIKIEQLLSHTSGIPELTQNEEFMTNISKPHTVSEIIEIGLTGDYRSQPGEKFIYCNTGYTIMAALIEKLSGKSYSEFLQENIFDPLEMSNTYSCDFDKDADNIVQRYYYDSTGYHDATVMHFSNLIGGGGIVSNVQDMAKWNMALLSGEKLPDNYEQLWESILLKSGESTGYGLGIGNNEHNGHRFYYHPGMGDGMNSVNLIFPDDDITITVIRNVHPPMVTSVEIALLIADNLLEN
jgi:CubicO group peptidase (beta-lactamase class C family)